MPKTLKWVLQKIDDDAQDLIENGFDRDNF